MQLAHPTCRASVQIPRWTRDSEGGNRCAPPGAAHNGPMPHALLIHGPKSPPCHKAREITGASSVVVAARSACASPVGAGANCSLSHRPLQCQSRLGIAVRVRIGQAAIKNASPDRLPFSPRRCFSVVIIAEKMKKSVHDRCVICHNKPACQLPGFSASMVSPRQNDNRPSMRTGLAARNERKQQETGERLVGLGLIFAIGCLIPAIYAHHRRRTKARPSAAFFRETVGFQLRQIVPPAVSKPRSRQSPRCLHITRTPRPPTRVPG